MKEDSLLQLIMLAVWVSGLLIGFVTGKSSSKEATNKHR